MGLFFFFSTENPVLVVKTLRSGRDPAVTQNRFRP